MQNSKPKQAGRLNDVADQLVKTLLPVAFKNRNFFVNDIPDHFHLVGNSELIASVLGSLLSTVVSYTQNSSIWLSAKRYGNIILIHIKNSNGFQSPSMEHQLRQMQLLAEKTRGTVGFTRTGTSITSLTYGFYGMPQQELCSC